MKSFKSSEWDELENLPDPYEKIYTFKNYIRTKNTAFLFAEEQAFAYAGFYIKIHLKGFPIDKLAAHPKEKPLVSFIIISLNNEFLTCNFKRYCQQF